MELPDIPYTPFFLGKSHTGAAEVHDHGGCEDQMVIDGAESTQDYSAVEIQFLEWNASLKAIMAIPAKERTDEQTKDGKALRQKVDRKKFQFPHLVEAKKPAKSAADRKKASKQRQSEESREREKEAARARNATEEGKAAGRARKATDDGMAATRRRAAAKRAGVEVKPNEGLNNEAIMDGSKKVAAHSIGKMEHRCEHCDALKFDKEPGAVCCLSGKVYLDRFTPPPDVLLKLWFQDTQEARVFRKNSRSFNNGLCFTSIVVQEKRFAGFTPSVIFQGKVYQFMGPLLAAEQETPRFAQLYVMDPSLETTQRIANMKLPSTASRVELELVGGTMRELQDWMRENNPFARSFIQVMEIPEDQQVDGKLVITAQRRPEAEHERRYNPQINLGEVSILTDCNRQDLVIRPREGGLHHVSVLNPKSSPLHFTVLFPNGDLGWDRFKRHAIGSKSVSAKEFYVWHIRVCQIKLNVIKQLGSSILSSLKVYRILPFSFFCADQNKSLSTTYFLNLHLH